jgi:predicted enzyme related to lactoylglutathione lyase
MLTGSPLVAFVPVTELSRAVAFYEKTLGLTVRHADEYGCMLSANGTTLRLAVVGDDYVRPPHTVVGWEVGDIAQMVDELVAAGVTMQRYDGMAQDERGIWSAPSGDLVAWFGDSEGNNLSLTQYA